MISAPDSEKLMMRRRAREFTVKDTAVVSTRR